LRGLNKEFKDELDEDSPKGYIKPERLCSFRKLDEMLNSNLIVKGESSRCLDKEP